MARKLKIFNYRSYEWCIYVLLWGMVWVYPLLTTIVVALKEDKTIFWDGVLHDWGSIIPFFLLFLLHRLPLHFLFMRHRVRLYVISVIGLLCLFGVGYYYMEADEVKVPPRHERNIFPPEESFNIPPAVEMDDIATESTWKPEIPRPLPPKPIGHGPAPERPPFKPLLLELVIATLMLGFDLAIAIFFRYQEELEKARRLETEHLRYQLEHLKAQINPHFFMNMLNSIHGMVELKPSTAQVMLMELSHLMRYVLYEGAKPRTTLCKETDFIANYVALMQKRYPSKKVEVTIELPEENKEQILLPPLLFINIIENAFKHGISYQAPSFVKIRLSIEKDKLLFECMNSLHKRPAKEGYTGGVGLVNLRQRLQLLYGNKFTLEITEVEGMAYQVRMIIPYEYDTDTMHSS